MLASWLKKFVGVDFSCDSIVSNYLKSRLEAAPTIRLTIDDITFVAGRQPFKSTDR